MICICHQGIFFHIVYEDFMLRVFIYFKIRSNRHRVMMPYPNKESKIEKNENKINKSWPNLAIFYLILVIWNDLFSVFKSAVTISDL